MTGKQETDRGGRRATRFTAAARDQMRIMQNMAYPGEEGRRLREYEEKLGLRHDDEVKNYESDVDTVRRLVHSRLAEQYQARRTKELDAIAEQCRTTPICQGEVLRELGGWEFGPLAHPEMYTWSQEPSGSDGPAPHITAKRELHLDDELLVGVGRERG